MIHGAIFTNESFDGNVVPQPLLSLAFTYIFRCFVMPFYGCRAKYRNSVARRVLRRIVCHFLLLLMCRCTRQFRQRSGATSAKFLTCSTWCWIALLRYRSISTLHCTIVLLMSPGLRCLKSANEMIY